MSPLPKISGAPKFADVLGRVPSPLRSRLPKTTKTPTVPSDHPQEAAPTPLTAEHIRTAIPLNRDGFTTIYHFSHASAGELAVKRLHMPKGDGEAKHIREYAFKEAKIWKTFEHASILPFIEVLEMDGDLCLVSPYVGNVSLSQYSRNHQDANIPQLLSETAAAILFIHDQGFVHGDINASHVLVSDFPHALLCDFVGLTGERSVRWESPELMKDGGYKTYASDVWAFGMTIYEALSCKIPFHEYTSTDVRTAVVELSKLPPKLPTHSPAGASYAALWDVAANCWKTNPDERATIENAYSQLQNAIARSHVLRQETASHGTLAMGMVGAAHVLSGPAVPAIHSSDVPRVSDQRKSAKLVRSESPGPRSDLRQANETSGEVESSQPLPLVATGHRSDADDAQNSDFASTSPPLLINADSLSLAAQSSSTLQHFPTAPFRTTHHNYMTQEDVEILATSEKRHKSHLLAGCLVQSDRVVALKCIGKGSSQRYLKEDKKWRSLKHVNLLEFIGILQAGGGRFLVSPWEDNGSLEQYLRVYSAADRARLIRETAAAVVYLHCEVNIVHGNIRASNILVSKKITALLCDFGLVLTKRFYGPLERLTGEDLRWRSPELFKAISSPRRTFQSDVYAFGMTIYQVLSGHVPFYESTHAAKVIISIKRGDRPLQQPLESPNGTPYTVLWLVGSSSWHKAPHKRPSIKNIYTRLLEVAPLRPGSPDMRSAAGDPEAETSSDVQGSQRHPTRTKTSSSFPVSSWGILEKTRNLLRRGSRGSITNTHYKTEELESSSPTPSIGLATPQHKTSDLPAATPRSDQSLLAAFPEDIQLTSTRRAPDPPRASKNSGNLPGDSHNYANRVFSLKVMDYGFKEGDKRRQIVKVMDLDNPTPLPPPAPGGFLRPLDAEEIVKLEKDGDKEATLVADVAHAPGFVSGWYRALYPFQAEGANELSLIAGNIYECGSRGGTPGSGWVIIAQLVGRQVQYGLAPERYLEFARKW